MSHLDKAVALIEEKFPSEWWVAYNLDKDATQETDLQGKIDTCIKDLNSYEEQIFDYLNIAILRGEYVEDAAHKEKLLKLKQLIQNIKPYVLEFPDQRVIDFLLDPPKKANADTLIKGFIEPIKLAINFYLEFLRGVDIKLNISQKTYIQGSYNEEISRAIEDKLWDENSQGNLQLLQMNIAISSIDHSLSIEDNQLSALTTYKRRLTSAKPYSLLIRLKAEYLSNKLKIRNKHVLKGKRIYNIINGEETEISLSQMLNKGIYDDWLTYADVYTLDEELIKYVKDEFENLRGKKLSNCTVMQLHKMIKYYKDADITYPNSYSKIKEIEKEFERRLKEAQSSGLKFDAYAYSICWNYAANNRFSIKCKAKDANVSKEKVEEDYNSVVSIQSSSGIKNFFPQVTYSKFLIGKLKEKYDQNKALEGVEECRSIIDKCHTVDATYKENVEWTNQNYNYVYQLPFKECCLNCDNKEVGRVFIFSSFLLPLPKDKVAEEYSDNQKEVYRYESSVKISENVKAEIKDLGKLKEELKGLKDKEYRMLEVLGIFTAIISFVAASLPTFKVIDTPLEAALFMLALATSMSWFVFLLLVTFSNSERLKERRKLIIVWLVVGIIVWASLVTLSHFNPFKSFNQPKTVVDEGNSSITVERDTVILNNTINNNVCCPPHSKATVPVDSVTKRKTATKQKSPC